MQAQNAQNKAYVVGAEWLFSAEEVGDMIKECGLDDILKTEEWQRFIAIAEDDKVEYTFEQAEAMNDFRCKIYYDTASSRQLKKLLPLTDTETDKLNAFLTKRYHHVSFKLIVSLTLAIFSDNASYSTSHVSQ